jgi:acetyl esterase/lipase/phage FluMu protein Com
MAIRVSCGVCGAILNVPESAAGKRVRCPKCQTVQTIRAPAKEEEPMAALGGLAEGAALAPPPDAPAPRLEAPSPARQQSRPKPSPPLWVTLRGLGNRYGRPILSVILPIAVVAAAGIFIWGKYLHHSSIPAVDLARALKAEIPPRGEPDLRQGCLLYFRSYHWTDPSGEDNHGRIRVYVPIGTHSPHSLPVVLIAPAGSTCMTGMAFSSEDDKEHTPWVNAGFLVVCYDVAGEAKENAEGEELLNAICSFARNGAGMHQARLALDYVLSQFPEADPARLYTVGHSSAGTLALRYAELDHRLAGCVAFAPVTDLSEHLAPVTEQMKGKVDGFPEFVELISPDRHIADLACPVWLFHADGDDVVSVGQITNFVARLREGGKTAEYHSVQEGDHYNSMINTGIRQAIQWVKGLKR